MPRLLTRRLPRPAAPVRWRWAWTPLAAAACLALAPSAPLAQNAPSPAAAPLRLRPSALLQEDLPPVAPGSSPATFVSGEHMRGRTDIQTVVEGHAQLRRPGLSIEADRFEYDHPLDTVKASGQVRINHAGDRFEGEHLQLRVDAYEGWFDRPRYRFLRGQGHGQAERIDFIDQDRQIVRNGTYTTCGCQDNPGWLLSADQLQIDTEDETARARGAVLRFKNLPILAVPVLDFPTGNTRKSGFLAPVLGIDNVSGLELTLPYYWNIAPNRDATFYPALMTRRGIDLGAELRYLENDYKGQTSVSVMPGDRLRHRTRWSASLNHWAQWQTGWLAQALDANLSLARVSDDDYWRDFTRSGNSLTSRLLAADGSLGWANGPWSVTARALHWQTLQDPASPIVPPFNRLPQLSARYLRGDWSGADLLLEADTTRFQADRRLSGQPNAVRSYALGQISYPWRAPGWFLIPKLQLHLSRYQFDTALADGSRSYNRAVPTFSLDGGLIFERNSQWFGRQLTQTLEPRLFYTHTPYRDQRLVPLYDSAEQDFNFASIFAENAFVGQDRIADSHMLTLGATTRLLDPQTGAEALRLGLAQRLRLADQKVSLLGTPVPLDQHTRRWSDILASASVNWNNHWASDATVQFDPEAHHSQRTVVTARYSPGNYRVVNASYRLQRGQSEQIDLGWQWPLNDLWSARGKDLGRGLGLGQGYLYSVGRLNYSLQDKKIVDAIVGFEYDAGCWIGRVVLERTQSTTTSATKRLLFQLELVGLARIGSSPLRTLRDNVPRYQFLREQVSTPSRFSTYE